MEYFRKLYNKTICNKICVLYEDLQPIELEIMEYSYNIIHDKINEIKELNDIIKNLTIENRNLKAYNDNKDY